MYELPKGTEIMILTCISSGSNANCYFLTNNIGEILILEAGSKIEKLMMNKNFSSFKNIVGCLITHQHKDHSKYVEEYKLAGIKVLGYMNLQPLKKYKLGSFNIIPFNVEHDVKNYGYIIQDINNNKLFVYATDFCNLPQIEHISNWLIECNYCQELWDENLMNDKPNYGYLGRVSESHMSMESLRDYFASLKTRPDRIILCHLSQNGNADKNKMISTMSEFSQFVDIATKNKSWEIK